MSTLRLFRAWLRRWLRPHQVPVYGPGLANVRRILCAFLFLLPSGSMCEPVWATTPKQIDPNNGCTITHVKPNEVLWNDCPNIPPVTEASCLATMREAMMLMDMVRPMYAYTRGLNEGMLASAEIIGGSPSEKVRAGITQFEKTLQPVMEQWNAAKACWKESR